MAESPPSRPSPMHRQHSSNSNLSSSAQARPKAHLVGKKNRSSGQLTQLTKLVKTHSGKNLVKLNSKPHAKIKRNTSHGKLKLDLGSDDEVDGWVDQESSTATSGAKSIGHGVEMSRSRTDPGFTTDPTANADDTDNHTTEAKGSADLLHPSASLSKTPIPVLQPTIKTPTQAANLPRMMNRNVSFAAVPEVSRIPASSTTTSPEDTKQALQWNQLHESEEPESVSGEAAEIQKGAIDLPSRPHIRFDRIRNVEHSSEDEDEDSVDRATSMHKSHNTERKSKKLKAKHSERMAVPGRSRKDKALAPAETQSSFEPGQSFSDARLSPEREPLPAATQELEPATDEPTAQRQLVQDAPMSRTQYRLNLERLHAMNFREPRQRPTDLHGHEGVYGDRRAREVDPLTGRVSIARVCREGRRELKVVRSRGRDPMGEGIDVVMKDLPLKSARPKGKEVRKVVQKRSMWSSGKRATTAGKQPEAKDVNSWTHQDRLRLVEEFGSHCKRLWDTPTPLPEEE